MLLPCAEEGLALPPWAEASKLAGTDVLLMRLRDEDVEILEENQVQSAVRCALLWEVHAPKGFAFAAFHEASALQVEQR